MPTHPERSKPQKSSPVHLPWKNKALAITVSPSCGCQSTEEDKVAPRTCLHVWQTAPQQREVAQSSRRNCPCRRHPCRSFANHQHQHVYAPRSCSLSRKHKSACNVSMKTGSSSSTSALNGIREFYSVMDFQSPASHRRRHRD